MKVYDGLGPNPRLVRMFIAEKKLEIHSDVIDPLRMAARHSAAASARPRS